MAKSNVSVAEALAVLANSSEDFTFTKAQKDAIAEMVKGTFKSQAVSILSGNGDNLPGKLNDQYKVNGEGWADRLFDLALAIGIEFESDVKTVQGGAVRTVRKVGINTPDGHLTIELRSGE